MSRGFLRELNFLVRGSSDANAECDLQPLKGPSLDCVILADLSPVQPGLPEVTHLLPIQTGDHGSCRGPCSLQQAGYSHSVELS